MKDTKKAGIQTHKKTNISKKILFKSFYKTETLIIWRGNSKWKNFLFPFFFCAHLINAWGKSILGVALGNDMIENVVGFLGQKFR